MQIIRHGLVDMGVEPPGVVMLVSFYYGAMKCVG